MADDVIARIMVDVHAHEMTCTPKRQCRTLNGIIQFFFVVSRIQSKYVATRV